MEYEQKFEARMQKATEQGYHYQKVHEYGSKFVVADKNIKKDVKLPKKVLIVDDSMPFLKLMSAFLRKMHIEASMAQSGNEAIASVQREPYALVLMDHMMKGKDGLETVKEIRQLKNGAYQNVPIIDVLSRGMEQYHVQVNKEYYQACLTKPIDYELLQQVMSTYGLFDEEQTGV